MSRALPKELVPMQAPVPLPAAEDPQLREDIAGLAARAEMPTAAEPEPDRPLTPDELLAQFGVRPPSAPAPVVGVLYAVPEDPFKPVGAGVDLERYEYARGVVSHDPQVGDLSIREMEKKGFVRLPRDFPARLAGVQGTGDVMMIRSKDRAAYEYAKESAERQARKLGPKRVQQMLEKGGVEATSTVKIHRRSVPRELAGV